MKRFLVGRAAIAGATVFMALTAIFIGFRVLPGDPARYLVPLGRFDPTEMMSQRADLHLGLSLPEQYVHYFGDVLSLRLGTSFEQHTPVAGMLGSALHADVMLLVIATLVTVGLGAFGWLMASRDLPRTVELAITCIVVALGVLSLLWLFLAKGNHLPFSLSPYQLVLPWEEPGWAGRVMAGATWGGAVRPAFIVGAISGACLFLWIRATARSLFADRAAGSMSVTWRRAWGKALRLPWPVLLAALVVFAWLLSFAEPVFPWPGMGQLLADARSKLDYGVVHGTLIIWTLLVPVGFFMVSLLAALLDPSAFALPHQRRNEPLPTVAEADVTAGAD